MCKVKNGKAKKIFKKIKENPVFKELFENSSGFSVEENTITFFNVKGVNETVLKNRLYEVKEIKVKNQNVKIDII